jgi:hypothetical protein
MPRLVHARRVVVTVIVALVTALARWLPRAEREHLAQVLLESRDVPLLPLGGADHDRGYQNVPPASQTPDWQYIWRRLLAADTFARTAESVLRDARLYFGVADLAEEANHLAANIDKAYSVMCEVSRFDGLRLEPGDPLDTVRGRVDIRRAELVDAELALVEQRPATDAGVWTVEYREHGGFLATSSAGGDAQPSRFWGFAATPQSAAATVAGYFLDRPPTVRFDPGLPAQPRPVVSFTVEADISLEGPQIHDLLAKRGEVYAEHIAACAAVRDRLAGRDLRRYLAEQADRLNATDPQLPLNYQPDKVGPPANHDHRGFACTVHWVPASWVVATSCPVWGEFGTHRPGVPLDIARGLAAAADLDAFTHRLFTDEMNLIRIAAWAGPLYRIGVNGIHRVHTARMLGLPWLAVSVDYEAVPPSWDLISILSTSHRPRQSLEQRATERLALINGLIRRGVIDGELIAEADERWPTLRCRRLPAPWLLHASEDATTVNAIYESRYPGALAQLGIPTEIGTEPTAWTAWLTTAP